MDPRPEAEGPPLGFSELVFSDLACYRPDDPPSWSRVLARCLFLPGLIASILVRAQQCAYRSGHRRAADLLRTVSILTVGAEFGPGMDIGTGLHLPHPTGIVMGNPGLSIGDGVIIAQGVTLGARFPVGHPGQPYPTICDGAIILAHATVAGGVRVGRHAQVAANSLVLQDVPDYAIVMGVPARLVGSREDEVDD